MNQRGIDPNPIFLSSDEDYIAAAFEDKTVFFITHRLTTIPNVAIILMMDRRMVAELGTHAELMALG